MGQRIFSPRCRVAKGLYICCHLKVKTAKEREREKKAKGEGTQISVVTSWGAVDRLMRRGYAGQVLVKLHVSENWWSTPDGDGDVRIVLGMPGSV